MIELRYNADGKLEYRLIKLGVSPVEWHEWKIVPSVEKEIVAPKDNNLRTERVTVSTWDEGLAVIHDRCTAERDAAIRERDEAKAECERLRGSLAACDIISNSNTTKSLSINRRMHPDYDCAAVQCVISAVEREIALRDRVAELEAAAKLAPAAIREAGGEVE